MCIFFKTDVGVKGFIDLLAEEPPPVEPCMCDDIGCDFGVWAGVIPVRGFSSGTTDTGEVDAVFRISEKD